VEARSEHISPFGDSNQELRTSVGRSDDLPIVEGCTGVSEVKLGRPRSLVAPDSAPFPGSHPGERGLGRAGAAPPRSTQRDPPSQGAEAPVACQYWNKAPQVTTKRVRGRKARPSVPGRVYKPRYILACEQGAWSIASWPRGEKEKAKVRAFKCRSWRHKGECSQWKGAQDFRRIEAALKENPDDWVYSVLTFDQNEWFNDFHAYKGLYGCWDKLRKRLEREWGSFKYIAVCEKHRNGWPHLNILIRNKKLAAACAGTGWKAVRKNWLEPHSIESGFGMRTWIEPVRNSEAMAGYVVKLCNTIGEVTKSNQVPDNAPKNFRRLRCSQGLLPPPYKDPNFTGALEMQPIEVVEHRYDQESKRILAEQEGGRQNDVVALLDRGHHLRGGAVVGHHNSEVVPLEKPKQKMSGG